MIIDYVLHSDNPSLKASAGYVKHGAIFIVRMRYPASAYTAGPDYDNSDGSVRLVCRTNSKMTDLYRVQICAEDETEQSLLQKGFLFWGQVNYRRGRSYRQTSIFAWAGLDIDETDLAILEPSSSPRRSIRPSEHKLAKLLADGSFDQLRRVGELIVQHCQPGEGLLVGRSSLLADIIEALGSQHASTSSAD